MAASRGAHVGIIDVFAVTADPEALHASFVDRYRIPRLRI